MTNAKTLALVRQRNDLVAQISIERAEIARNGISLRRLSGMIDKFSGGLRYLKRHPETLLLPVVITVLTRPWRLLALAVSGFGAWRMVQGLRRQILS